MSEDRAFSSPPGQASAQPRRSFVGRLAAAMAAWPLVGRRSWSSASRGEAAAPPPREGQGGQPNAALILAVAGAVLPSELGDQGTARAADEFRRWMDGYEPGVEANHGYGTGTIVRLPNDPRPRWRGQLAALDEEARRVKGQRFASLSREDRQALLRPALADERGESLPLPLAARHVAVAMLAHFYDSPAANDLCYEVAIARQQCRPLAAQRQAPVPLARRAR